jgi:Resolvase, N terminal domain
MSINAVNSNGKVTAAHLKKTAYLYIRQSTLRQVFENTESTQRQYALRQRAVALGWPAERIEVIDCDQGQSGASTAEREGFQKLVAEVGLGKAGIVMGLEVSRLARNCADWHRLLEICALSATLILDEDGPWILCTIRVTPERFVSEKTVPGKIRRGDGTVSVCLVRNGRS